MFFFQYTFFYVGYYFLCLLFDDSYLNILVIFFWVVFVSVSYIIITPFVALILNIKACYMNFLYEIFAYNALPHSLLLLFYLSESFLHLILGLSYNRYNDRCFNDTLHLIVIPVFHHIHWVEQSVPG